MSAEHRGQRAGHQAGPLAVRGLIEGFYGPAWTERERLRYLDFAADVGLTTYVYAPKDDPYHRLRWREPYPDVGPLAALARAARERGVELIYGLHPWGITASDDREFAALVAKADQLLGAGVGRFALLFDDIPPEFESDRDRARYPGGRGQAHGELCGRFLRWLRSRGIGGPLPVAPTDYAGTQRSAYREAFAAAAPREVWLWWTGRDIVVGEVTDDEAREARAAFGRPVVLWDNFPVNDFAPDRLFLGPLVHRPNDPDSLLGIMANPMVQATASLIPLATVAEYATSPATYRPAEAWGRAIARVAGLVDVDVDALGVLARACGGWPPSAPRWAEFEDAVGRVLGGPGTVPGRVVGADDAEPAAEGVPDPDAGQVAGPAGMDVPRAGPAGGDALRTVVDLGERMRAAGSALRDAEGFGPWGRALAVAGELTGAACDLLACLGEAPDDDAAGRGGAAGGERVVGGSGAIGGDPVVGGPGGVTGGDLDHAVRAVLTRRADMLCLEADVLRPQVITFADAVLRLAGHVADPGTESAGPTGVPLDDDHAGGYAWDQASPAPDDHTAPNPPEDA